MPLFESKEACEQEVGDLPWPYVDFEKIENPGRTERKAKKRYQGEVVDYTLRYPQRKVHFRLFLTDNNGSAFAWMKGNLDQVRKYMLRFKVIGYGNFERYRHCQDAAFAEQIRILEAELQSHIRGVEQEQRIAALEAENAKLKSGKRTSKGAAHVEAA